MYDDDDRRSNNSARGRLAALILGTSVMRLRHWYAVAIKCDNIPPIPQPFDESDPQMTMV